MAENNIFIVDASYVLQTILPDERSVTSAKKALKILTDPKNKIISSKLLEFEVGNGLKSAYLSKRVKKKSLNILTKNFTLLPISFQNINIEDVLLIAVDYDLTFYDATYVYLANKFKIRLLTLDENLSKITSN